MNGATVLAIAGLLAALVGSIDVNYAPWASRIMLVGNIVCLGYTGREWLRQRRARNRRVWDKVVRAPGPYSDT